MEKISHLILIVACFELVTLSRVTCLTNSPQVPSLFRSRLALKTTNSNNKAHFVLVHGAGHGAWCWYKLTALLETAGHNVTVLDLAGCGINPKQLKDVVSLQDYAEPLMEVMDSIPDGEKVVLVSHSLGGLSTALAMEAFAEKISVAVFVAAVLVPPNSTLHQFFSKGKGVSGCMYDTKFSYDDGPEHGPTSVIFGPQMLAHRLYQQSPLEDLKLATVLLRETRVFTKETTADDRFTRERYGSVPRVYAFCGEDKVAAKDELQSMIDEAGVEQVDVIEGADHMAMLSRPQELFSYLSGIAEKYA